MLSLLALLGCGSGCPDKEVAEPHSPVLCPDLFDEDRLVDIRVEIAPEEWQAMREEYVGWEDRKRQGLDLKPYHPLISFRANGEDIDDAQIRLKGNPCCSWEGEKMQFVIAFNKVDEDGRFAGLRKLTLDAPPYDASVMRERIALSYFRDAGIASSCANHARLTINGDYYGLYTNIEHVDREFLERQFPDHEGEYGNLYKWGYNSRRFERENNGDGVDDIRPYRQIEDLDQMEAALDVDQALYYWAAETVINQSDGYWAGSINFYLYHHPERGWQYFPWDLDNAVTFWRARRDPFAREDHHGIAPFMDWVLADPAWKARWTEKIALAHTRHDPDLLIDRLDRWTEQIRPHVEEEPYRAFSMVEFDDAIDDIRKRLLIRDDYLCDLVHPD